MNSWLFPRILKGIKQDSPNLDILLYFLSVSVHKSPYRVIVILLQLQVLKHNMDFAVRTAYGKYVVSFRTEL
jgi:hypothetical protein